MALDIMLADLGGFEVCKMIRKEEVDTGVLFLTEKDSMEDNVKNLILGCNDNLTKLFSPKELVQRLHRL